MGCTTSSALKVHPICAEARPEKDIHAGGICKSQFIPAKKGDIREFYKIADKKLGEGTFGWVRKGTNIQTGAVHAIKCMSKAQMKDVPEFQQEIAIMKMMDHPNIVRLYETWEDHKNIYLVMELCRGGELFDRIVEAGHFTEAQCIIIMTQIIRAIGYMHENRICHRDLKPENFLFTSKEGLDVATLKLIDFGLSCHCQEGEVLTLKAGTADYVSPQVLSGQYDHLSDMWSVGVIMYVMLCGYPPFHAETQEETLGKVFLGNFTFDPEHWKGISDDAKQLIRALVKRNPKERLTAEQALKHRWITSRAAGSMNAPISNNLVHNLKSYRSHNKLKKAALHIIANQLDERRTKRRSQTFHALDRSGVGRLTADDMKAGMQMAGFEDIAKSANLMEYMKDLDLSGSGAIDYTEFLAATLDEDVYTQEAFCREAFRRFDKDGSGDITLDELKEVLGEKSGAIDHQSAEDIMLQLDTDDNGVISFEEFMQMMRR